MRDFALETFFSKWEFAARYHMTASDVQSLSVGELLAMADLPPDALGDTWLGYTQTWGAPDLRDAIANTYENLQRDNVLCFAGAEEGVYATMRVALKKGDHAIVVVPNYQAAETIPLDICEVTGVALDEHQNWRLDIDALRAEIRDNTVLISVCFPNNPTGSLPQRDDFDALIELCREYNLYLFSDEVYRGLEIDPDKKLPAAAEAYEKGVSLSVMSKAYGLPGLRIGWIVSRDTALLQKLERYKHYLSICNSAPSERLAVIALGVGDQILARNHALMRKNLAILDAFFADYPNLFEWQHPDGGCIAYPKYTGVDGVSDFCAALLEQSGVLLLPATIYHSELMPTPANRFRIGFGRANIDAGLTALRHFLDQRQ